MVVNVFNGFKFLDMYGAMALEPETRYISLGPLDHIAPCNIPQSIIYLGLKQHIDPKDAFVCLREGLCRTIHQAPWLNGRVHFQSRDAPGWRPGQLEIRYKAPPDQEGGGGPSNHSPSSFSSSDYDDAIPLRFKELPSTTSYNELREAGFPLDRFEDEALLWTSPFQPDFGSGVEVLAAQANFLPGGCLLVLSIAPPASDGTAMLNVTRLWADHCSSILHDRVAMTTTGHQKPLFSPAVGVDREALDRVLAEAMNSSKTPEPPNINQATDSLHLVGMDEFQEFTSKDENLQLDGGAEAGATLATSHHNDDFQGSGMEPSMFYMPQPMYAKLRQELVSVHNGTDVSGNDVICAFIWRSVLRARTAVRGAQKPEVAADLPETTATLAVPFDARRDLAHLLSAQYLGNLNFEHIFTLPLRTLISPETTVAWVAKTIRTEITRQTQAAALLEAYGRLRSVAAYDPSRVQIRASCLPTESPSVGILSPMTLPFNGTCFGEPLFTNGGRPEAFRPMMGMCNRRYRTSFVIPRKQHGGIDFVMTLSEEERAFLQDDDEFNRYAFSTT
ncbi:hypothetical protein PG994_002992 [Apiospora phragmitis]|uniref:Uncharacterized protein n=1 Tax=Apiospora phragmitis TaxID=2905665 RepID=A0ABR1W6R8_9PEZI